MTTAYGLVVTQVRRTSKTSNLRNHKPNLDNMLQVSGYSTRPQTSTRTTPGRRAGGCGETVTASMSPTASRAGSPASGKICTYTNLFLLLPFYHSFIQLNIPAVLLLRYSGAPDDWKYDTINFYSDPAFIGSEVFTYGNRPTLGKMDNRARSLIGQLECRIGDVRVKCKVGCKM